MREPAALSAVFHSVNLRLTKPDSHLFGGNVLLSEIVI